MRSVQFRGARAAALYVLLATFLVGLIPPVRTHAEEGTGHLMTVQVLGARVRPLKKNRKPWDADHKILPPWVYRQLTSGAGYPSLFLLAFVPYRNRPDPYVGVFAEDQLVAKSRIRQGTFLPNWRLRFRVAPKVGDDTVLVFEVRDKDLQDDDPIGQAEVELGKLRKLAGLHVLDGDDSLYDLSLVVKHHDIDTLGGKHHIQIDAVRAVARRERPAGGDWDVGGNPIPERLRRLPGIKKIPSAQMRKPDLKASLRWSAGGTKKSKVTDNAFEMDWKDIAFDVAGYEGVGDGLYVEVSDMDLALADPVGSVFVPLEDLLGAREAGVLEVEVTDRKNGLESLSIRFKVK